MARAGSGCVVSVMRRTLDHLAICRDHAAGRAGHNGAMSGDDELERLLREVDATLSGSTSPAASSPARREAPSTPATGSRWGRALRTGLVAGVVAGVLVGGVTLLFSWLPLVDHPFASGASAFLGAFGTGAVLGASRRGGQDPTP